MDSMNTILLYGYDYCWAEENLANPWEAARDDMDGDADEEGHRDHRDQGQAGRLVADELLERLTPDSARDPCVTARQEHRCPN